MKPSVTSGGSARVRSVGMNPGATALTAMLRPPYSFAIAFVKPTIPAFAAA